jgi:hypothetical protein
MGVLRFREYRWEGGLMSEGADTPPKIVKYDPGMTYVSRFI